MKKMKVFLISLTLLLLALAGARAHAATRFDVVKNFIDWRQEIQARTDLDDREKDLRMEFLDRLIFQTERKYKEESLYDFLLKALDEMIETDQMTVNQSFGTSTEFLTNLRSSLENLIEKKEDPLTFTKNFLEYSGISEPATADEFAETRSYYDGKNIATAHPLSLEEAANLVEAKERQSEKALESPGWRPYHQNLLEEYSEQSPSGSRML